MDSSDEKPVKVDEEVKSEDLFKRAHSRYFLPSKRTYCCATALFILGMITMFSFSPGIIYSPPYVQTFAMTPVEDGGVGPVFRYKANLRSQLGMIYPEYIERDCDSRRRACSELTQYRRWDVCESNVTWFELADGSRYSCMTLHILQRPPILWLGVDLVFSLALGLLQVGVSISMTFSRKGKGDWILIAGVTASAIAYLVQKSIALYVLYTPPQMAP